MTKTQIQVPDELIREIRSFAKAREWSLAETFRRGAELLLEVYDAKASTSTKGWQAPVSSRVGWKGLTPRQLREAAMDDSEPRLHKP
jgi:hypothetical protein